MMTLWRWANEPSTRANSFHSEPIPLEDHQRWFNAKINDPDEAIYILLSDDEPIGQVRLSRQSDQFVVSYSIAAEHRRRGFGKLILRLVEDKIPVDSATFVGRVKKDNVASRSIFRQLNYAEVERDNYFEYTKTVRNRRTKIIWEGKIMTEKEFLTKMKEDILDTEDKLAMDTELAELEDWDSLAIVDFIAMANTACGKKVKRVEVTGAKTFADLYALLA